MTFMKRITALLLCLALGAGFTGCTSIVLSGGGQENPTEAVRTALDALKEGKLVTVARNVVWEDMELLQSGMKKMDNSDELIEAMFSKMTYEIKGEPTINGEKATLAVAVTTKDLQGVLASFMISSLIGSLANKQQLDRKYINSQLPEIIKSMNSADVKMVTKEIPVHVAKVKNKWKVEVDGDFENAVLGGAASLVKYYLRVAAGVDVKQTTAKTTAKPSTTAGPSTTLSKEQREKAARVQSSLLAELREKASQQAAKQ